MSVKHLIFFYFFESLFKTQICLHARGIQESDSDTWHRQRTQHNARRTEKTQCFYEKGYTAQCTQDKKNTVSVWKRSRYLPLRVLWRSSMIKKWEKGSICSRKHRNMINSVETYWDLTESNKEVQTKDTVHAHAHAHAIFISTTTKPLPDSATNTDCHADGNDWFI